MQYYWKGIHLVHVVIAAGNEYCGKANKENDINAPGNISEFLKTAKRQNKHAEGFINSGAHHRWSVLDTVIAIVAFRQLAVANLSY